MLSIITGTLDRPDDFSRLLRSLINKTAVRWELICADAGDTPIMVPCLPNVTVIREVPRLGYSRGYNQAVAVASGEFVLWLNDDAEVLTGYAEAAIDFMEAHPEIGLGALYYQEGGDDFHVRAYFQMCYANFGIMRREFFNAIGGFDEDLPMYGSDNAIAFKVLLAGKGIAGIPDARIIHHATNDIHRIENDNYAQRCRDAEILANKYGPHMAEMQATYARLGCESNSLHDQTPEWLKAKVAG